VPPVQRGAAPVGAVRQRRAHAGRDAPPAHLRPGSCGLVLQARRRQRRARTLRACGPAGQKLRGAGRRARVAAQVDFIIGQLKAHADAAKLLAELQPVLDEEAPGFVLKLFRSVIFDTEKQALGLLEA
jgi:hypothetical protein